jgi:drug/metabolite transporter (DMT)-like permease
MRNVLGTILGLFGLAVAAAVTVAAGAPSSGGEEQYASALFIAGLMLASPFLASCAWVLASRHGRTVQVEVTGRVLLGIGVFRWLGICLTAGPVFSAGSLLLIALGAAALFSGRQRGQRDST